MLGIILGIAIGYFFHEQIGRLLGKALAKMKELRRDDKEKL